MRQGLVWVGSFLTAALLLSLSGCERYALDRQMEELCKKDGGIKVYETVTLPAQEYEAIWKYVSTAPDRSDYYGPNYQDVHKEKTLVGKNAEAESGDGQLSRLYWAIYRRSDGKLLGEQVQYLRAGGDLFTFGFQPSGKGCPFLAVGLAHSIFIKGE